MRAILQAKGAAIHMLAAADKASTEWLYTERDLDAIAPPLTRILNRYPATAAAGAAGDELAVVVGLGGYVTRSYVERRQALAAMRPQEPQPVTGRAPEPGDLAADQPLHAQPSEDSGLRPVGPDARRYADDA